MTKLFSTVPLNGKFNVFVIVWGLECEGTKEKLQGEKISNLPAKITANKIEIHLFFMLSNEDEHFN